jgi:LemA protein
MSRMVYNDTVTRYNRQIRQIPDSIVAGLFHFVEKQYLKDNVAKANMPSLKI